MTHQDETLIQEVEEGLRRDRQLALLRRYGPIVVVGFVTLLIGLGGWLWYQDYRLGVSRAQADKFLAVPENAADHAAAAAAYEALSAEGPEIYRVMAMMQRASVLEGAGDLEAALAAFDAAAAAADDPVMADAARMRAAYIVAETQDFDALRVRLQPLIESGGRISYLARELLGVEAWEAGDEALARETFENLNLAFDAPESVRQRVNYGLAVLGPAPDPPAGEAAAAAAANGDAQ